VFSHQIELLMTRFADSKQVFSVKNAASKPDGHNVMHFTAERLVAVLAHWEPEPATFADAVP
jgi:hypothetical protein